MGKIEGLCRTVCYVLASSPAHSLCGPIANPFPPGGYARGGHRTDRVVRICYRIQRDHRQVSSNRGIGAGQDGIRSYLSQKISVQHYCEHDRPGPSAGLRVHVLLVLPGIWSVNERLHYCASTRCKMVYCCHGTKRRGKALRVMYRL